MKPPDDAGGAGGNVIAVGRAFPNLRFQAVDGRLVDVQRLRGRVVLIDFWATWCGPCVAEMPNVLAVYKKYQPRGFEIIGVSLDSRRDALLKFVQDQGMTWPQYFDGGGWKAALAVRFGVQSIPHTVLLDRRGTVRHVKVRGRALETAVAALCEERAP